MQVGRRSLDVAAGLLLLALGVFVWLEGRSIPPSLLDPRFGSGYILVLAGGALVVLAAILVVRSVFASAGDVAFTIDRRVLKPAVVALLLALFVLDLQLRLVPFYPAAALFVFVTSLLLAPVGWRSVAIAAVAAAATAGVSWIVFTQVFTVLL